MSTKAAGFEPVSALNITPLIDVLLVLIVMFILCLPAALHQVPLDLPGRSGAATEAPVHRLAISRTGALSWDGAPIDGPTLTARLRAAAASDAQLTLAPDAQSRFEVVDHLLVAIRRAGLTRIGFEGSERYRTL